MKTLTAKEVSQCLNVNYRTVLKMIEAGELKAFKVRNKIYRIEEEELQNYLKNGGLTNGISSK